MDQTLEKFYMLSLAGPNLKHNDDEFLATAYPKVLENLKLITDERVIDDKLEIPTAVDKYLGTKLDDALLKVLERHTAENQKRGGRRSRVEEKQDSTYSIQLLIVDEVAMDKEVARQGERSQEKASDSALMMKTLMMMKDFSWIKPGSLTQEMLGINGNDSDMEDTDNAHIPKVSTTTWFKPIPESERPATPEPEWTIPPNDFPEPENNWANTYATAYKVPEENKLQRKTYRYWVEYQCSHDRDAEFSVCSVSWYSKKLRILLHKRDNSMAVADYQEYKISEKDSISSSNVFEDMLLINILFQEKAQPICPTDRTSLVFSQHQESLSTKTEMIQRKLMRRNEHYKFSDGTLQGPFNGKTGHMGKELLSVRVLYGMETRDVVRG
ncbi:hypothetical protein Tco_0610312 [Tanacetum coccineum]